MSGIYDFIKLGWNLISFQETGENGIYLTITEVEEKFDIVIGEKSSYSAKDLGYNSSDTFYPGRGYWVKVLKYSNLTHSPTSSPTVSPTSSPTDSPTTFDSTTENNDNYFNAHYLATDKSITLNNLSLLGSDKKDWYTFSLTKRHQVIITITPNTSWSLYKKIGDMFPELVSYNSNENILDQNKYYIYVQSEVDTHYTLELVVTEFIKTTKITQNVKLSL